MKKNIAIIILASLTFALTLATAALWIRTLQLADKTAFEAASYKTCAAELQKEKSENSELKIRAIQAETLLWKHNIKSR